MTGAQRMLAALVTNLAVNASMTACINHVTWWEFLCFDVPNGIAWRLV